MGTTRLDTALNEVYYNNTFGDPSSDRAAKSLGHQRPAARDRRRDCRAARERSLARSRALRSAARRRDEPGLCGHPARPARHRPGGHENRLVVLAEVDLRRSASRARPVPHRSRISLRSASANPGTARSRPAGPRSGLSALTAVRASCGPFSSSRQMHSSSCASPPSAPASRWQTAWRQASSSCPWLASSLAPWRRFLRRA